MSYSSDEFINDDEEEEEELSCAEDLCEQIVDVCAEHGYSLLDNISAEAFKDAVEVLLYTMFDDNYPSDYSDSSGN